MSLNPNNICAGIDVPTINSEKKLETIFALQTMLQKAYGADLANLNPERERPKMVKEMVLALTDELHELLNRIPWKTWRNYKFEDFHPSDSDLKEIKMEIVDALHFFVNLCLIFNLSAQELFDFYVAKNKENIERIKRGYARGSAK